MRGYLLRGVDEAAREVTVGKAYASMYRVDPESGGITLAKSIAEAEAAVMSGAETRALVDGKPEKLFIRASDAKLFIDGVEYPIESFDVREVDDS